MFNNGEKLITVTDKNGNITECNDAFVEMSGFTRDELLGQPHNIV
ncbi:MAG: PAS domain S-box protein, partial [Oceanisphaera sp.]|nr:PAS domain S-box protein [Oceanisphaera sp.]